MTLFDLYIDNQGIGLHYRDTDPDSLSAGVPAVFIPGFLGNANSYEDELVAQLPRRSIVMSLRGRGESGSPQSGYTFADHISDIETVIKAAAPRPFCLIGYSQGAAYAIEYTARHPEQVRGLIIGDYPARSPYIPPEWVDRILDMMPDAASPEVVGALQQDSEDIDLSDRLPQITCPVMVIRGGKEDAILTDEDVQTYTTGLANALILSFDESGHQLWKPDPGRYHQTIAAFLKQIDLLGGQDATSFN